MRKAIITAFLTLLATTACITLPEFIPTVVQGTLTYGDASVPFTLRLDTVSATVTPTLDAGTLPTDAGEPDSGVVVPPDTGILPDSGVVVDSGVFPDSGVTPPPVTACNLPQNAQTLFYCPDGADGNPGTPSQPRASLAQLASDMVSASVSTTFALCNGGQWSGTLRPRVIYDPAKTHLVTSYGDPALPNPVINNPTSDYTINLAPGSDTVVYGGMWFANLTLVGQRLSPGVFTYRRVQNIHLCNLDISNHLIGVQFAHTVPGSADFSVDSCNIHDNQNQGFLGGGDNLLIANSTFRQNGRESILDHNMYVTAGTNIRILNNSSTLSSAGATQNCMGTNLVLHGGKQNDVEVAYNTFTEPVAQPGCWGIGLDDASTGALGATNVNIHHNTFTNMGNVSIGLQACENCTVADNTFTNSIFGTAISAPSRTKQNTASVPLTGLVISGNHMTMNGTCMSLDPAVVVHSDLNTCNASSFANGLSLSVWQSSTNFDLNSVWN